MKHLIIPRGNADGAKSLIGDAIAKCESDVLEAVEIGVYATPLASETKLRVRKAFELLRAAMKDGAV